MNRFLSNNQRKFLMGILIVIGLLRLFTLGAYPLMDTTESRYAEVARKMVETGNWVTPQIDYGVPFWAKPPLSTWVTAASLAVFGINEFAARLSSFLLSAMMCWLVYLLARKRHGPDFALVATVVLVTTAVFFFMAGGVMTDPALALGTTLAMVAFWRAMDEGDKNSRFWGYLFFIGLAVGLLAKGPIATVLTFLPIGAWVLWHRNWKEVWNRLPWITGLILMLALSLPWYLLAESRTPGFLEYFIVGEHWKRFTVKGWKGDLYGTAHAQPRGLIWLDWLAAAIPWSLVALASARRFTRQEASSAIHDKWISYLLLWTLAPMVFFTMARNILPSYVLPGIPAFAILVAEAWCSKRCHANESEAFSRRYRLFVSSTLSIPIIVVLLLTLVVPRLAHDKSHKDLVARYESLRTNPASKLVFLSKKTCSSEFYTKGAVVEAMTVDKLTAFFNNGVQDFFVSHKSDADQLPKELRDKLERVANYGSYTLYRERANPAAP